MAGPDLPPWSTASRESSRSPPSRESVWHAKQLWANSGRILAAKNAASESAASRDAAQTRTRAARYDRTIQHLLMQILHQSAPARSLPAAAVRRGVRENRRQSCRIARRATGRLGGRAADGAVGA